MSNGDDSWNQQYQNQPLDESSQNTQTDPTKFTFADDYAVREYAGLKIGPYGGLPSPPKNNYFMLLIWTEIPWYARLLGLLRLPYDLARFVVTGRFMFIPWPWRW